MNRWLRLLRLPFLSVTLCAWAAGTAAAAWAGVAVEPGLAAGTLAFALLVHAAANVLNDYFDARNGTDAANVDRVAPFTGGSRLIQDGEIGERAVGRFGALLMLSAALPATWLAIAGGPQMLAIGVTGVAIGCLYSAPPVALMSRGVGEVAIAAAWGLLVVGSAGIHGTPALPAGVAAAPGYALMVAAVLFLNTFPDRAADARAGKCTLVVRLGARRARVLYPLLVGLAQGWPVLMVLLGRLPPAALVACASLPLSVAAAAGLWRDAQSPAKLAPAIRRTIGAAIVHGLGLAGGLAYAGFAA